MRIFDLFSEDSQLNVYAVEREVRPPGAPTTQAAFMDQTARLLITCPTVGRVETILVDQLSAGWNQIASWMECVGGIVDSFMRLRLAPQKPRLKWEVSCAAGDFEIEGRHESCHSQTDL